MVPRWRLFGNFLHPVFSASRAQHVSDLHSKFALSHIMCGSTADIQSPTAEIRQGKKEEERRNHRMKYIWPAVLHMAAINYDSLSIA